MTANEYKEKIDAALETYFHAEDFPFWGLADSMRYSLTQDAQGHTVRSTSQLKTGDRVRLRFAEGGADCTVDSLYEGEAQ